MAHADDLQAVSVDEALIEVTSSIRRIQAYVSQNDSVEEPESRDIAKEFADAIRTQVRKATQCEGMLRPFLHSVLAYPSHHFLDL